MRESTKQLLHDLQKMEEYEKLLKTLQFHHASQSKPNTGPVSKDYHRKLAHDIASALNK